MLLSSGNLAAPQTLTRLPQSLSSVVLHKQVYHRSMIEMQETIFFTSAAHKQRLIEAIVRLGKVEKDGKADPWYAAGLYILSADMSTWTVVQPFISSHGIQFDEILSTIHFSSGYVTMIEVAANLFRDSGQVDLGRFTNLDEKNFQVVMEAIKIRRYSLQMSDLHAEKGA
jgi:hypothetical protein